ncbi:MAG: hypothetical protein OXN97_14420 [Bryobacterales bacterium]|nr:hypothetical protein [Bryobacterales bacterium]
MSSDSFRNETVGSITLPSAAASDDGEAFYEVEDGSATVSFGAARSGSVTAPKLPRLTGDGGKVIGATRAAVGSTGFDVNVILTDAGDDENTNTLSNNVLGMTHSGDLLMDLIDWYDDNPNGWTDDLDDLHPSRNVAMLGDVLITTARTENRRL